jgi:hypothetical protein
MKSLFLVWEGGTVRRARPRAQAFHLARSLVGQGRGVEIQQVAHGKQGHRTLATWEERSRKIRRTL